MDRRNVSPVPKYWEGKESNSLIVLTGVACCRAFPRGPQRLRCQRFASANDLQGQGPASSGRRGGSAGADRFLDKMMGASLRGARSDHRIRPGQRERRTSQKLRRSAQAARCQLDSMELVPDILPLPTQGKFRRQASNLEPDLPNAKAIPAFARRDH